MKSGRRRIGIGLTWGVLMAAAWGCGDSATPHAESSKEEAKVTGKVTVKGAPASKGQVIFDPSNVNRKDVSNRTAVVGPDGTYEIMTLIGENTVSAGGTGIRGEGGGMDTLSFDVQSGTNTLDIDLPLNP